jgi:hypothetical protein
LLVLLVGCLPQGTPLGNDGRGGFTKEGQSDDTKARAALTAKFRSLNRAWDIHCERRHNSSCLDDFLSCKPYRALAKMGKPAIPLIMEVYGREDYWEHDGKFWECVLDDITGLSFVDRDGWDRHQVRNRYLSWWKNERKRSKTD